jgi:steroid Delta-isomerase
MADVTDRVEEHFRLFNEAVRTRDWTAFLATFTPDAVMSFEGIPAGPYEGLDQIARAYAEQPPSDTMTCVSDARDGDRDVIRFRLGRRRRWHAAGDLARRSRRRAHRHVRRVTVGLENSL